MAPKGTALGGLRAMRPLAPCSSLGEALRNSGTAAVLGDTYVVIAHSGFLLCSFEDLPGANYIEDLYDLISACMIFRPTPGYSDAATWRRAMSSRTSRAVRPDLSAALNTSAHVGICFPK